MTTGKRDVSAYMDRDWETFPPRNKPEKLAFYYKSIVADPLVKFKQFIDKNRKPYYWYHRKYNRVPTIDQCWDHDSICRYEADQQIKLDKTIESQILIILRQRLEDCMMYEGFERREKCKVLVPPLMEAQDNFFIKYGETGFGDIAHTVFMKQKHRLAWERRHGEVGTGMKDKHYRKDGTVYWA